MSKSFQGTAEDLYALLAKCQENPGGRRCCCEAAALTTTRGGEAATARLRIRYH